MKPVAIKSIENLIYKMKIFLDTEFTGLHQTTTLISLGLVAENGHEFYAEFNDYDVVQLNEWVNENVLPKLEFQSKSTGVWESQTTFKIKNNKVVIATKLREWFMQFGTVEIWADVLAYDWILFCELFGGAMNIPDNIFYAPFDLATVFRIKGLIEPASKYEKDIARFEFAGINNNRQHNSLEDARIEKICFEKLTTNE